MTPDCVGQICSIKLFDPTGLAKHKVTTVLSRRCSFQPRCRAQALVPPPPPQFEEAVPKAERPRKPKVNQMCTSLKKLKAKEERRIRRKRYQQARQETRVAGSQAPPQEAASACRPPQKGNLS